MTEQEQRQLQDLITRNPHLHYSLEMLNDVWNQRPPTTNSITADNFQLLHHWRYQPPAIKTRRMSIAARIAAKAKQIAQWITGMHADGMQKNLL